MRRALLPVMLVSVALETGFAQDSTTVRHETRGRTDGIVARAQQFFTGIYVRGDPAIIDEVASDNIAISYPVFKQIYGKFTLRGKDDVKRLCANFTRKFEDRKVSFPETIADEDTVVLVWSFEGRWVNAGDDGPSGPVQWAGISVLSVNKDGKIDKEYGLETDPSTGGAFSRLLAGELTSDIDDR